MAGEPIGTDGNPVPKPDYDILDAYVPADLTGQDWLIVAPVALMILSGSLLLVLRRRNELQLPVALGSLGLLSIFNFFLLQWVVAEGPQTMTMGRWLPPFGISFTVDVLGALLAFIASLVSIVGVVFASREIEWLGTRYGFYPFVMMLMAGVCGSFHTGDLFNLYVWFEVLLISSFGLFILGSERLQLDGTIKYAFLNLIATTLFLIATGYTYAVFGTLNMADLTAKAIAFSETGQSAGPIYTITALFFMAFGMKAAAFPVNFWLPASYHTPRIVVSALFAGLLTKVGAYAFIRVLSMIFAPFVFAGSAGMESTFAEMIGLIAALTMVLAGFGALAQDDVRRMAGYTVISGIGMIFAGVAMNTGASLSATTAYAIHSMITMTALYMALGLAGSLTGSFSMRGLGGIYAVNPFFAALFLILVFAVAGLPPFSGFWPKLALVKSGVEGGHWWIVGAILFSGLLTTIALGRVWAHAFWRGGPLGTEDGKASTAHIGHAPDSKIFGDATLWSVAVLVGASVVLGLFAGQLFGLTDMAGAGLLDTESYIGSVFPTETTGDMTGEAITAPVTDPQTDVAPAATDATGGTTNVSD